MSKALEAAAREIVIVSGEYTLGPDIAAGIARAAITAYLRAVARDEAAMRAAAAAGGGGGGARVREILLAALRELEPKE